MSSIEGYEEERYTEFNLIRENLDKIKSDTNDDESLKLALLDILNELTDQLEKYAKKFEIRSIYKESVTDESNKIKYDSVRDKRNEQMNNDDSIKTLSLTKGEGQRIPKQNRRSVNFDIPLIKVTFVDDDNIAHDIGNPVWKKKKKKKKANSKKGKASCNKHQKDCSKSFLFESNLESEKTSSLQGQKITEVKGLSNNYKYMNEEERDARQHDFKIFSLHELEIALKQENIEEFKQEIYEILNHLDIQQVDKTSSAQNHATKKFVTMEKELVTLYESLTISQKELIEICKNMMQLDILNKISDYKINESIFFIDDAKEDLDICADHQSEYDSESKEKINQLRLLEAQEANVESRIDLLKKITARKSQIQNEIAAMEKKHTKYQDFKVSSQNIVDHYEHKIHGLECIQRDQASIPLIVNCFYTDFKQRLEEYKQAKEKIRNFCLAEAAELNASKKSDGTFTDNVNSSSCVVKVKRFIGFIVEHIRKTV